MPTTQLRVERDDFLESAPPGWLGCRDPKLVSSIAAAAPGSYEVLLDDTVIGALSDFQALSIGLAAGHHVVATRAFGAESMICVVSFTAEADSYYDTTTCFLCRANGLLEGPDQMRSTSRRSIT